MGFFSDSWNWIKGGGPAGDVVDVVRDVWEMMRALIRLPVEIIKSIIDIIKELPDFIGDSLYIFIKTLEIAKIMIVIMPALIIFYFVAKSINYIQI